MLDQLALGGQVTVIGLVVVFLLLIILIGIIKLLNMLCAVLERFTENRAAKKAAKEAAREKEKQMASQDEKAIEEKPIVSAETPETDEELVAVLTAAVAAMTGALPSQVRVASFKKTTRRSAWAQAGRREQLESRI